MACTLQYIPHGTGWDSHTCFSANGIVGPDGNTTRFYYVRAHKSPLVNSRLGLAHALLCCQAGGNGPHSGPRADGIGLATAHTHALAGLASVEDGTATITTHPLRASAAQLRSMWVLAEPGACDTLRVQLLDADGVSAVSGFGDGHCSEGSPAGDVEAPQRQRVAWGSMLDDAGFGEQEVVLRLTLHGTAYAFGFAESA